MTMCNYHITPAVADLAQVFLEAHKTQGESFKPFGEFLVRSTGGELLHPYVPFVGDRYDDYRILLLAKAQSFSGEGGRKYADKLAKQGEESVYRLCRRADQKDWTYQNVPIAPVQIGVLPALCGIYLFIHHKLPLKDLDDLSKVTRFLAVSNFHKYSLGEPGKKGPKDLNPDGKHPGRRDLRTLCRDYARTSFECYVREELNALKPSAVFHFAGAGEALLAKEIRSEGDTAIMIHDPSSLLRGGPPKSWKDPASEFEENAPPILKDLIEGYLGQIQENRQAQKRSFKGKNLPKVKTYFYHYARNWLGEV